MLRLINHSWSICYSWRWTLLESEVSPNEHLCLWWAMKKLMRVEILPSHGKRSTSGDKKSGREGPGRSSSFVRSSPAPKWRCTVQVGGTWTSVKWISYLLCFELQYLYFTRSTWWCGFCELAIVHVQKHLYKFGLSLNSLGAVNFVLFWVSWNEVLFFIKF